MGVNWRDVNVGIQRSRDATLKSLEAMEEVVRRAEVECKFHYDSLTELGKDTSYGVYNLESFIEEMSSALYYVNRIKEDLSYAQSPNSSN